jgi:hypothetical protein
VLNFCKLLERIIESYSAKLFEMLESDLIHEESKEIWGMSSDKSGLMTTNINPRIYVLYNNILFCHTQAKSMSNLYNFSGLYSSARSKYSTYEAHADSISLDTIDKINNEDKSQDVIASDKAAITDTLNLGKSVRKLSEALESIENRISKGVCPYFKIFKKLTKYFCSFVNCGSCF